MAIYASQITITVFSQEPVRLDPNRLSQVTAEIRRQPGCIEAFWGLGASLPLDGDAAMAEIAEMARCLGSVAPLGVGGEH